MLMLQLFPGLDFLAFSGQAAKAWLLSYISGIALVDTRESLWLTSIH